MRTKDTLETLALKAIRATQRENDSCHGSMGRPDPKATAAANRAHGRYLNAATAQGMTTSDTIAYLQEVSQKLQNSKPLDE